VTDKQVQKQVIVVGGGVVGVCTAYFLAMAGHEVAVLERCASVAEEASFGNAGIIAPGYAAPFAGPGVPGKLLTSVFRSEAPMLFRPHASRALWRWVRQWQAESEPQRYLVNQERMRRVAFYSQQILNELMQQHPLDYEKTHGVLQLFQTEKELAQNAAARALLAENGVPHRLLDAEEARAIEPGLAAAAPLAGALYFPDGESGNCALFTKQLRQLAQSIGVQFHFMVNVDAIQPDGDRIGLRIGEQTISADRLVLAAGAASTQLLQPLGIDLPLYPVKGYSITLPIRNFDAAPVAALIDESHQVAITRIGNRLRIAGIAELGSRELGPSERAMQTLIKAGDTWFPGAAPYQGAALWHGARPMLPEGPPLLGATPIRNLFLNLGHGAHGWAMAAGSGKILADLISQRTPEIDLDGLTLARYG
jgi:D-amino-acid dehydrogenase